MDDCTSIFETPRSQLIPVIPCSKVSKVPKSQARLPQFIKSHFSTLMFLIKSLPSAPTPRDDEDESDASGLLLTAVSESTKLLPWVMDNKKQLKAYLKVGAVISAVGDHLTLPSIAAIAGSLVIGGG